MFQKKTEIDYSNNEVMSQWRIHDFHEVGRLLSGEEGALTYDFANFSQKLHEIERISRIPP